MNISSFITWFVAQVVTIFTFTYTTLNNITFGGTSLLKVIIFVNIIVPFLMVILTINSGGIGVDWANYQDRKYARKWDKWRNGEGQRPKR